MGEEERRKKIVDQWIEIPRRPNHFISKELKIARSTVDAVLKRYFETLSTARKEKVHSKSGAHNKKMDQKITKTILGNRSMSSRDVAKLCGTNQTMVQRCKKRVGLKTRKKQKIAKVTEKQQQVIKTRSRKLYDFIGKKKACLVLDDETYVKTDFATLPGSQFYTSFEGEFLSQSETSIAVQKFGSKYLVWQAICQCGNRTTPFVTIGNINTEVYIKECIRKILIPFIKKHKGSTLFWPDLATSHYARSTTKFLTDNNIDFVPKEMNPPNVPQCRPIERYWALVKRQLRTYEEPAKDLKDFKKKWKRASKKITDSTVKNIMKNIRKKLREEWDLK